MASALWAYGAKILANCDNLGLIADQQLSAIDGFATRRRSPEGPALLLVVVEELKQDVYFEIDSAALQPRALSKLASSRLVALGLGAKIFCHNPIVLQNTQKLGRTESHNNERKERRSVEILMVIQKA